MKYTSKDVIKDLNKLKNADKAKVFKRFFKAGKGEYGEGDKFIGVTVPQIRTVAKKYKELSLKENQILIKSPIHEHRLCALLILVDRFKGKRVDMKVKKSIYEYYLKNKKHINNWDLVDLSAQYIVGGYLMETKDRTTLYKLAKSKNLWERRIAIISTFELIRYRKFDETLKISEILLNDKHDLIHKAVGWMLRELGNRDQVAEEKFLQKNYDRLPRTTLRYAIEKFGSNKKKYYLKMSKMARNN